ncbi:MAG: hypothetical protein ACREE3_17285 [Stellaceae bacterium]
MSNGPLYDCGAAECQECERAFGPGRRRAIAARDAADRQYLAARPARETGDIADDIAAEAAFTGAPTVAEPPEITGAPQLYEALAALVDYCGGAEGWTGTDT